MAERFTRHSFSLPKDMLARLKAEARERDLSISQIVREAIRKGESEPTKPSKPSRGVTMQILCPACKRWKAPQGANPGLVVKACQCHSEDGIR